MSRSRLQSRGHCDDGQGESIDFTLYCPKNAILKTVKAHWAVAPVTPLEPLVIWRDSPFGSEYDSVVLEVDPEACTLTDYAIAPGIEFTRADVIHVEFPNSDDKACSAEIIVELV